MKKISLQFILFTALLLGAIVCTIEYNGMRQFGGMDHSVMINVAWSMVNGQKPYQDFFCTLPPAFYLGSYSALKVGGLHWRSFVHLAAIWASISFLAQVFLSKKCGMGNSLSLLYAFCCQALTFVFVSYWWYNPYTISSCLLLYFCVIAYTVNPTDRIVPIVMVLVAAALLLGKPNVAFPMLFASFIVSFFSVRSDKLWAACWGAAGLLALGILALYGIHPLDVFHSYQSVAVSRGLTWVGLKGLGLMERPMVVVWTMAALVFFRMTWASAIQRLIPFDFGKLVELFGRREDPTLRLLFLSFGTILVGIYAIFTNMEPKFEDMSLLFAPV